MINTSTSDENLCGLKRTDFQKTVDGKQTDLFILKNENGVEIAVTNYGGAVLAIMAPDKNGKFANVIQGHDSIDHVINSHEPFLSTLIGRYGNRIANGKFLLDGQEYSLTINNGPNSLHGGPTGFHARVWDAEQVTPQSLKLHYLSADGEEGFPGNLDVTVVYTLSNQNEFIITYSAVTDKTTLVNLTHHGFFSLSGIANPTASVENNIVTINADFYTPMDNVSIPTGEIAKVEGTPIIAMYSINANKEPLALLLNVLNLKADAAWRFTLLNRVSKYIQPIGTMALKALTVPLSLPEALSALKPNISLILRIKVISLLVY